MDREQAFDLYEKYGTLYPVLNPIQKETKGLDKPLRQNSFCCFCNLKDSHVVYLPTKNKDIIFVCNSCFFSYDKHNFYADRVLREQRKTLKLTPNVSPDDDGEPLFRFFRD